MVNNLRGEVAITFGGEEFTLRPTFTALVEIENQTRLGLVALCRKFLNQEYTLSEIVCIIRAGIKAAGGKCPDALGDLIFSNGMVDCAGKCAQFLTSALSGGEEKNAEAPVEQS